MKNNPNTTVKVDGVEMRGFLGIIHHHIDVTSMNPTYGPEESWEYLDDAGHPHTYNEDGKVDSIERVVTKEYWCEGCRDEHTETTTVCIVCGEEVIPGTKIIREAGVPASIAGPVEYTLEVAQHVEFNKNVEVEFEMRGTTYRAPGVVWESTLLKDELGSACIAFTGEPTPVA